MLRHTRRARPVYLPCRVSFSRTLANMDAGIATLIAGLIGGLAVAGVFLAGQIAARRSARDARRDAALSQLLTELGNATAELALPRLLRRFGRARIRVAVAAMGLLPVVDRKDWGVVHHLALLASDLSEEKAAAGQADLLARMLAFVHVWISTPKVGRVTASRALIDRDVDPRLSDLG